MNFFYFFVLGFTAVAVDALLPLTKEIVLTRASVRLVRKDWRPKKFEPGTDEPLLRFPGNKTELRTIFKAFKNFEYVSRPLSIAAELFDDPNYNSNLPSIVLTHPLTFGDSAFIKLSIFVFSLRNLQFHYNIFAIHAPWLSLYFQMSCLQTLTGLKTTYIPMAEGFSSFMLDGIYAGKMRPDQISFLGFSYAGTLNGYMARYIKSNTGQLTHTILSLDAFQHNYNNTFFTQLTAQDAHYVHIIHSSSAFGGTFKRRATVDVVLNNGYLQPGCNGVYHMVGCSHRRSVIAFLYAILSAGNMMARRCENWKRFTECECTDEKGYPQLVVCFPVNQEARGRFFVRTTSKMPYLLGPRGAYCASQAPELPSSKNSKPK